MIPNLVRVSGAWRVKTQNGYHVDVKPMLRMHRLVEVPEAEPRDQGRYWCYATSEAAILAAVAWDVDAGTEPVGYVRSGGARP